MRGGAGKRARSEKQDDELEHLRALDRAEARPLDRRAERDLVFSSERMANAPTDDGKVNVAVHWKHKPDEEQRERLDMLLLKYHGYDGMPRRTWFAIMPVEDEQAWGNEMYSWRGARVNFVSLEERGHYEMAVRWDHEPDAMDVARWEDLLARYRGDEDVPRRTWFVVLPAHSIEEWYGEMEAWRGARVTLITAA